MAISRTAGCAFALFIMASASNAMTNDQVLQAKNGVALEKIVEQASGHNIGALVEKAQHQLAGTFVEGSFEWSDATEDVETAEPTPAPVVNHENFVKEEDAARAAKREREAEQTVQADSEVVDDESPHGDADPVAVKLKLAVVKCAKLHVKTAMKCSEKMCAAWGTCGSRARIQQCLDEKAAKEHEEHMKQIHDHIAAIDAAANAGNASSGRLLTSDAPAAITHAASTIAQAAEQVHASVAAQKAADEKEEKAENSPECHQATNSAYDKCDAFVEAAYGKCLAQLKAADSHFVEHFEAGNEAQEAVNEIHNLHSSGDASGGSSVAELPADEVVPEAIN